MTTESSFPLDRATLSAFVRAAGYMFPFDGFSTHLALGRRALQLAGTDFYAPDQLLARETSFCVRDDERFPCAWRIVRSDWVLGRFTSRIGEQIGEGPIARIRLARACGVPIPWDAETVPPEFRRISA